MEGGGSSRRCPYSPTHHTAICKLKLEGGSKSKLEHVGGGGGIKRSNCSICAADIHKQKNSITYNRERPAVIQNNVHLQQRLLHLRSRRECCAGHGEQLVRHDRVVVSGVRHQKQHLRTKVTVMRNAREKTREPAVKSERTILHNSSTATTTTSFDYSGRKRQLLTVLAISLLASLPAIASRETSTSMRHRAFGANRPAATAIFAHTSGRDSGSAVGCKLKLTGEVESLG